MLALAGATAEYPLTITADRDLVATAAIAGANVLFLIDTGSNASVIDQAYCAKRNLATKAGRGSTTGIHGERQGLVLLAEHLAMGRRNRGSEHAVVGLLGADYLLARKAVVDLGRLVLTIPD